MSATTEQFARYTLPCHGAPEFPRVVAGEWREVSCEVSETVRDPQFVGQCVWMAQADRAEGAYGGQAVLTVWGTDDYTRPLVADLRPYNLDQGPLPCLHMVYVVPD